MPIVSDLIDRASLTESDGVVTAVRVFYVSDLPGNPEAILFNALMAAGVPGYGEYHPAIPYIRVTERNVVPNDADQAFVIVTYKKWRLEDQKPDPAAPPQIEVGATVQEAETDKDVDGNQIKLNHTFKDPDYQLLTGDTVPTLVGTVDRVGAEQTGVVKKEVPMVKYRMTRSEDFHPGAKALRFVGTVNRGPFMGMSARKWICTAIEGTTDDGGQHYKVVYEFQYNRSTWDAVVVYTDPDTNEQVVDPVDGVGVKTVQIYEEENFQELNIGELKLG